MKNVVNVIVCSLAVICSSAVHAAIVTVPQGPSGLTFTGNSDLTFSSDVLAALEAGNVQIIGYTGSPVMPGNVVFAPGSVTSPTPLVWIQTGSLLPIPSGLILTVNGTPDSVKLLPFLGQSSPPSNGVPFTGGDSSIISGSDIGFGSAGVTIGDSSSPESTPAPGLVIDFSLAPDYFFSSDGLDQVGGVYAASVPELGSLPMMGLGLLALGLFRRAKRS